MCSYLLQYKNLNYIHFLPRKNLELLENSYFCAKSRIKHENLRIILKRSHPFSAQIIQIIHLFIKLSNLSLYSFIDLSHEIYKTLGLKIAQSLAFLPFFSLFSFPGKFKKGEMESFRNYPFSRC